jgi:hypothetical protein
MYGNAIDDRWRFGGVADVSTLSLVASMFSLAIDTFFRLDGSLNRTLHISLSGRNTDDGY